MTLETILLIIWSIDAIVCVVWLYAMYRRKHPKPCDNCKHLKRKKGFFHSSYRYYCGIYAGIADPPAYCSEWEERERMDNNA